MAPESRGRAESATSVLVVAGESSGDLYGGLLARELVREKPDLAVFAAGGRHLEEGGARLLHDSVRHAAVGLVEAVRNLGQYRRMFRTLQEHIRRERPGAVVLIDLPDFNLRFGRLAKEAGIPVAYYVSPQVWAWRAGRIRSISQIATKVLVILPFEEEIYRKAGMDAVYVGHPLLDVIPPSFPPGKGSFGPGGPLIGLLPASRRPQFARLFPVMIQTAHLIRRSLPEARFALGLAPAIEPDLVQEGRERIGLADLQIVEGRTYDLMAASDLLIVTSGTSTLEAGIIGTPMIVTYKFNPLSALLGLALVRLDHYALVNIVAGRRIVPEYYQWLARPKLLAREALRLIQDGGLGEMRRELAEVRRILGEPGASRRAARHVLELLK